MQNLKIDIQECKQSSLQKNDCLNKIELKKTLKEKKMDTMRRYVSEMKNICTTKYGPMYVVGMLYLTYRILINIKKI